MAESGSWARSLNGRGSRRMSRPGSWKVANGLHSISEDVRAIRDERRVAE
jgi:hypothetical protein